MLKHAYFVFLTAQRDILSREGQRSTLIGIGVSFVLVLIKGITGYAGNSYALIADAIESASDMFTSIILLIALRIATKEPDDDHPYGHGKAEPLAGMAIAFALIISAILIAVESIHKLRTPHALPEPFTLWVLAVVILIKEMLFRYVIRIGLHAHSTSLKADAWHHRSDALTSGTAFIGISIALIGGKGYEFADDWAALLASIIIVVNAYLLFRPALAEIMDAAPPSQIFVSVSRTAYSVPGVKGVHNLKIRKMGFELFADMHILVDGQLTVNTGHRIAHEVKDAILKSDPRIHDVLIHIEPV